MQLDKCYGQIRPHAAGALSGIISSREGKMYQPPKLEFYGTFRELTRVGTTGTDDGNPIGGNIGFNLCSQLNPPFPPGICVS